MDPAFRDFLARAAQDWLLSMRTIPPQGTGAEALRCMLIDKLGESPADFMEAIIVEMCEIDAWNK